MSPDPPAGEADRKGRFVLARLETRLLRRMASALPRRVVPDHLTVLGVVGALAVGAAYVLANRDHLWLWAASAGLVVQWAGDSLDGTLARVRGIERPRYGFYLDHVVDAFSTIVVGLGLGLSPYMLLSVGLAIVVAYLLLSINVYLETHVYGEFDIGYGWVGPTEARIALVALNTVAVSWTPATFGVAGLEVTLFDVVGAGAAAAMVGVLVVRVAGNLRRLGRMDPPPEAGGGG